MKNITWAAGLTTNDTVTIAGTTYAITSVGAIAGGVQTVTLNSDCGVVAADAKVGLDWASWNGLVGPYFSGSNTSNIKVDQVVAGVYTNKLNGTKTFSADARLIVRKIGTSYTVWYNEALVGSAFTPDTAATTCMYHGCFSSGVANTIASMVVYDTGDTTNAYKLLDKFISN